MSREQSPTRAEIIQMAREAGIFTHKEVQPEIERFAALIASRVAVASASVERDKWMDRIAILIRGEREACAKVCEDLIAFNMDDPGETAAKAIRARGETSSRGETK